jgi:hypothetical protein
MVTRDCWARRLELSGHKVPSNGVKKSTNTLDPTIRLAPFDDLYNKNDLKLQEVWGKIRRRFVQDPAIRMGFNFCESEKISSRQWNQALKWVCVKNTNMECL